MPRVVLYTYWRSSSSYRVRFALAAKGIDYEAVAVNLLAGEQRSDSHHARSPTGFVPCLVVDDHAPVIESVAIIELLEELYPEPPLYPEDPWERARVRALVEIVNSGTQPLQNLSVLERVSPDAKARVEWARHFNERGLASFEAMMERNERAGVRGRFAYGDALTAADAFLVPQVYSARRFGVDLAAYPRVLAAATAAEETPAARAAAPEAQADAKPS